MKADLAIINGKVITVDNDFSIVEALAIKGGQIAATGSNAEINLLTGPETRVIDLQGKTILPGINDSHMHGPFFGVSRPPLSLDLTFPTVQSIPDIANALRDKVAQVPAGTWIRGFGWDQSSLAECKDDPSRLPRRWDLDEVAPDHPVAFSDFSGHTLLANSKALEIAGITSDTADPATGEMERNENGEPTGIFKESGAQSMVANHVPLLTREEKKTALITAQRHLNENGVTSFTDAAIGPGGDSFLYGVMSGEFVDIYRELQIEGALTTRVTVLLLLGEYGALTYADLEHGLNTFKVPTDVDEQWLQFPGVKIFADGIPLTYTSWMNEDYISGDAGHGTSVIPGDTDEEQRDRLIDMIKLVHRYDYQIGVHATGDRAIDIAVEGFAQAFNEKPGGDPRHYIIHGDFTSGASALKLSELNCGIAMQPYIGVMISDFDAAVVGEERAAYEWPTRTALDAGLKLTSSSDAPVTYPNWRLGVQAAVLREGLVSGQVSGPEQCITVEEAIRSYTINPAWQDHMEDVKGSIEVGKLADLCVIGGDILTVDPHDIGAIPVLMTIAGGEIVFDSGALE
ncbi:MAG: amidohydrolase family protein [Halieaceae bacterium]|jgi:predicted amidohydrolase YtcJ|nr:amidohydrolase family protein [Halieaceae bacterium]